MSGDLDQFFTGHKLARRIIEWAELSRGMRVLEPSAGDGAFVRHLPKNVRVTAVEVDRAMVARLRKINRPAFDVIPRDFPSYVKESVGAQFDLAIMNPPYGDGRDGEHVLSALRCCNRVIALVRVNFCFGVERFNSVMRFAELSRRAILVRRPVFYGPADLGHTARHDYEVIELNRSGDRTKQDPVDRVDTEFWTDSWRE